MISNIFLKLIKMIIGPLCSRRWWSASATWGRGDGRRVGPDQAWCVCASIVSLLARPADGQRPASRASAS